MPDQTLEQDIRDEAAHAQKYGGGMASLDFAVLDEWADRAAQMKASVIKLKEEYIRVWDALKQARGVDGVTTDVRLFDKAVRGADGCRLLTPEEVAELYAGGIQPPAADSEGTG